ncbi:phage tail assembly protein [Pectobacterium carotovorum]|uniref:phage tail assembly protein n=1 Tax=Pectobacterium TaxID=122277 RepID=UPI000E279A34|nr:MULTISPECIES: phage tail assembly protein [Pectobacterium]QHQ17081.1 phage tail assembly protein [Pectobacterium parmentieri]RRN97119.1 phage tail assembly protein [Pectobacterium aquaticum]RRO05127.1 phage tail assembly protein [Pectobacterium aquaticum]TAI95176.1 phage tail assembly protein [Pectobacterium versatile]UEQ10170.1 phage tail assembly protein [Pectobacterium versatile]
MNKHDNVVTLETPIQRGETVIDTITLIKPNTGTLRGVSLAAVAGSDVDAMIKVLPRMTLPALTETEITRMELPDMIAIAGKVIGFLTPKSQQGTSPEA